MHEQDNTQLVKQAYQNFKSGDIPALLNQVSEGVLWQLPDIGNVAFSGKRHGRAQVAEFFSSLADTQEALEFEPREFIAQGDKVAVSGYYCWRIKATGREFGGDWVHIFTVRDGQISQFQEYMDTAAAAQAYTP